MEEIANLEEQNILLKKKVKIAKSRLFGEARERCQNWRFTKKELAEGLKMSTSFGVDELIPNLIEANTALIKKLRELIYSIFCEARENPVYCRETDVELLCHLKETTYLDFDELITDAKEREIIEAKENQKRKKRKKKEIMRAQLKAEGRYSSPKRIDYSASDMLDFVHNLFPEEV